MLLTNVTIILGEEAVGAHATPHLGMILLANAPWVIVPLVLLYRMGTRPHPFPRAEP
jgi:hypothetical protein